MKKSFVSGTCLLLSIVSCGGSKSGGGGSSTLSGQFIDSPVKGLNIEKTISGKDVTGAEGKFSCVVGEGVTFKLRDLLIGSSVCGEKIYLDDVVVNPLKRDFLAAVIQNLSTTVASSGLIDLSAVPAGQTLGIDLTDANTVASTITTARTAVAAAASVTLAPAVTIAQAKAHADSNIPAPDATMTSVLDAHIASEPTIKLTKTNGVGECSDFWTAKLLVKKVGNGYVAAVKSGSVIGSNGAPATACTPTQQGNNECVTDSFDFEGVFKVIKNQSISFIEKETYTESIATGVDAGKIRGEYKNLITGETGTEVYTLKDDENNTTRLVTNIKGYFPFTVNYSSDMNLTFANDGTFSGSTASNGTDRDLTNWISESDYVLTNSQYSCSYSISKF